MNKLSSILGAAAVIAIAVVFIVQFRPATGAQKADTGPTCAAEIHGNCITTSFFWASNYLLNYRGVAPVRLRAMNFRRQTVDGLIETWLLNQDAKRLGITVSDDDVSAEIAAGRAHVSLPADKVVGTGSALGLIDARFRSENLVSPLFVRDRKTKKWDAKTAEKQIRMRTRLSPAEFRDFQRQELIAARMRDLIRSRVRVSENEAYEEYAHVKSTAQIDFVRLDRGFYADVALDTSAKAVDDWAEKNKEELDKVWESRKAQYTPECRVSRQIIVPIPESASDELKADKQKRAARALLRVNAGEDFADVARAMSEDPTALRGGEFSCVGRGALRKKPVEDALFGLAEGKITSVVDADGATYILKLEKIAKDAEAEKLGRHAVALDLYAAHESDRLATVGAQSILASVRGGKSLKDALETHLKEVVRPEDDAKKADKKAKKADKKADKKATAKKDDKADASAEEDKPLTAETHPRRPVIESSPTFSAVASDPIPTVRPGTNLMKAIFDLEKAGDVPGDIVPLESGYAVFQLKDKKAATREQFDKEKDGLLAQMRVVKQNDALIAYVKRLQGILASDVVYTKVVDEPPLPKSGEDSQPEPGEPFDE